MDALLRRLAEPSCRQPLSQPVPNGDDAFRAEKGDLKLAVRTLRRGILLQLSGQKARLQHLIDPTQRRLLWIHEGMPQVGDALMDLAPRSLLVEQGVQVDLFAAPHLKALFDDDPWFGKVMSTPEDVRPADYDLALVLSHDRKALKLKRSHLPALDWVSLLGYYDSGAFHRARFITQRLADLLGLRLDESAMARHSRQKLGCADADAAWARACCPAPADAVIAVGGVSPNRTYTHWVDVMRQLHATGLRRLILIGSDNGRAMAARMAEVAADLDGLVLIDQVAKTSLRQAHALIERARVALCADGGLMHLACATRTPVVGLYCTAIAPEWREPLGHRGASLVSPTQDTSTLPVQAVVQATLDVRRSVPPDSNS